MIRDICGASHPMPSGSLRDAVEGARAGVATAMLFVQSLHGISHDRVEHTCKEHLEPAARALDRLADATIARTVAGR